MLKGIPAILSPDLLRALCQMGHGDELVIADGNFPSESIGRNQTVIRADGHGVPEILEAALKLLPLDSYVEKPVALMQVAGGDTCGTPPIWETFQSVLERYESENSAIEYMERFSFYRRAEKAFLIIATGERAIYANILLKKGVVQE